MSRLTIRLLGPPCIERDGNVIELNRRKAVALIAYLAISGKSHPRDELATFLWPTLDQSRARAALRRILVTVKKAIGETWLEISRESLTLRCYPGFWLDVEQFHAHLETCRSHGHALQLTCPACLAPLAQAISLYRDDFMAGFTLRDSPAFDDWQLFQSESLRREISHAMSRLIHGHSTQGDFDQAIAYAQQWLALDPFCEPARRQIMQLYTWTGQRQAALRQYEECLHLLDREWDISPQQETVQLYHLIREDRLPPPPCPQTAACRATTPHLPAQPTPFLGREKEMAEINDLLQNPDCRLLTLVGPGGIGKTRLALQAAAQQAQRERRSVHFAPLAAVESAERLVPAIANAFNFTFQGETDPQIQLINYLRERRLLLILDNLEHLLDGIDVLAEILRHAPGVRVLVTSRQPLDLRWEWLFDVHGLEFPEHDTVIPIEEYSAVQLFLQSAERVYPGLSLDSSDKMAIVHICRFLEGLPLGIELAATWVQSLTLDKIAQEIERDIDFLTTSMKDISQRHRSLRAVFDHSWDMLSEEEQCVFKRLSVFRGGFRREAAEHVAQAPMTFFSAAVRTSFLRRAQTGRYEMLEVLRQYLAEQLRENPADEDDAHHRHCTYYTTYLQEQGENLKGGKQKESIEQINAEIENVRAAWQWAIVHEDWAAVDRSATTLFRFYEMRGWLSEGEETLNKAIRRIESGSATPEGESDLKAIALAKLWAWLGRFYHFRSYFKQAQTLLEKSLAVFQHPGRRVEQAFVLRNLGTTAWKVGRYEEAGQYLQQAMVIYEDTNERWGVAGCLDGLGVVASEQGDYSEARRLYREGLNICEMIDDRWGISSRITNLGLAAEALGEYEQARRLHQVGVRVCREIGHRWEMANNLNNLGFTLHVLGDCAGADDCFQEALEIALDNQTISIALEALVGRVMVLTEKGKKQETDRLILQVLNRPSVQWEIRAASEQILSDLEHRLATHPSCNLVAIYERIRNEALYRALFSPLCSPDHDPTVLGQENDFLAPPTRY